MPAHTVESQGFAPPPPWKGWSLLSGLSHDGRGINHLPGGGGPDASRCQLKASVGKSLSVALAGRRGEGWAP